MGYRVVEDFYSTVGTLFREGDIFDLNPQASWTKYLLEFNFIEPIEEEDGEIEEIKRNAFGLISSDQLVDKLNEITREVNKLKKGEK